MSICAGNQIGARCHLLVLHRSAQKTGDLPRCSLLPPSFRWVYRRAGLHRNRSICICPPIDADRVSGEISWTIAWSLRLTGLSMKFEQVIEGSRASGEIAMTSLPGRDRFRNAMVRWKSGTGGCMDGHQTEGALSSRQKAFLAKRED